MLSRPWLGAVGPQKQDGDAVTTGWQSMWPLVVGFLLTDIIFSQEFYDVTDSGNAKDGGPLQWVTANN